MRQHSLKDLIRDLKKDLGFDRPPVKTDDEALVRTTLEQMRPDLLIFLRSVSRDQTTITLEFAHSAAAQECQMESGRLLAALERTAGAAVARSIRCRGPR